MRVLDVHADHCSFETVAAPPAEDAPEPEPPEPDPDAAAGGVPVPREGGFDDCLAVLVAVEGPDATDPERVAERAATHLERRADDLRVSRLLCYPCPPLSERTAAHETTVAGCRALARALPADLDCYRAPVGWHHALALETAGHPFDAVVSRFDATEAAEPAAIEWTAVTPAGAHHDPDDGSLDAATEAVADRLPDTGGEDRRPFDAGATPPGPFATADPLGGRRLGPAGRLVHDLVVAHARGRLRDHGATPVEAPATYDLGASDVAALLGACGESCPGPETGASGTLRASTRLGVCSLLREATLSRADCPVRLTETGPVRTADGGSTVPTAQAVASDREGGWAELRAFATLTRDLLADCGHETVPVCRVGSEVPAARVEGLAAALDRPVLVGRGGEGAAADLTFRDPDREQTLPPRVRLEPGLAARAGIEFDGSGGEADSSPVLVDCTPVGSPDDRRRGLADPAPDWLAPTQVRFVTVDAGHRDRAADFADGLVDAGLRADVDDRSRPVGERLDRAAADRVPYTVVVGDREDDGGALRVHDRRAEQERDLSPAALVEHLRERTGDHPRREPYGSRFVDEGLAVGATGEGEN